MENGWLIRSSVGAGGSNRSMDVVIIQTLLNTARPFMGQGKISVDGSVGGETIGAITDFQIKSFGVNWADGRVDPNGQTLGRLNEMFSRAPLRNPKTYRWGTKFSLTVGEDGRIFVQP